MSSTLPSPEADLVAQLTAELNANGSVELRGGPTVPVQTWRTAARRAGRALDRPVRTYAIGRAVGAWLADWPRDAHEEAIRDARNRQVAEIMDEHLRAITAMSENQ